MQQTFIAFTYPYLSTLAICIPSFWICYYSCCFSWAFLVWFTLLRDSINNSIIYILYTYIFISAILCVQSRRERQPWERKMQNITLDRKQLHGESRAKPGSQKTCSQPHASAELSLRPGQGHFLWGQPARTMKKRFKAVATLALN